MSSLFSDTFAEAALPAIFAVHAEAGRVRYQAPQSSPLALTAVIGSNQVTEEETATGRRRVVRRTLTISTDPTSSYGGVASPALNATVTLDGVVYAVEALRPAGASYAQLVCRRSEALEVSRPDYRREFGR